MHILILPSWYPKTINDVNGVFFRDQALALQNFGHKVGLVAPQMKSVRTLFDNSPKTSAPYFQMDSGLHTYRKEVLAALPRIPYGNYWLFKATARNLLFDYIKHHGMPDIIHAHAAIYGGAAAVDIAKHLDIPIVLTEHSSGFARGIYSNWQLKLANNAIEGCKSLISVSPSLGDFMGRQFHLSKDKWKYIPNVVAQRFNVPDRFYSGKRPVRFLNLALMTINKGQFDLVKAFHSLLACGFLAELWLAGDGPIRGELEAQVLSLGIREKVHFMGVIAPQEVPKLLSEIDVMVVSSHYETFGVVAAEALMAGVPVIATRCGGPECIVEFGDGLLVPPKQPVALGQAMLQLGEDLQNYNRKDISERAKRRFSGNVIAAHLTEEYERVLSNKDLMKKSP